MRILLIRLSSLGDIVLTTPAFAFIKNHAPDAAIDFLCSARSSPLLEHDPNIARVLAFPKEELDRARKGLRLARFVRLWRTFRRELRAYHYDHVIDLHNVTDSALLALVCKAKVRTGNARQLLTIFFTRRVRIEDRNELAETHAAYLAMLAVLESGALPHEAVLPALPKSALYFDACAAEEAERFIQDAGLAGKNGAARRGRIIGINPTASRDFKRWPAERFVHLARKIHETFDCAIILFGAERDRAFLEERSGCFFSAHAASARVRSLAEVCVEKHPPLVGKNKNEAPPRIGIACGLPLPVVCALIARLDLFVGADSGLMHIAAAFDIPQAAIFGHSSLMKFYPLSGRAHVLRRDLACSPCTPKSARACKHRKCFHEITCDDVWREVRALAAEYCPDMVCRCVTGNV